MDIDEVFDRLAIDLSLNIIPNLKEMVTGNNYYKLNYSQLRIFLYKNLLLIALIIQIYIHTIVQDDYLFLLIFCIKARIYQNEDTIVLRDNKKSFSRYFSIIYTI